MDIKNIAASSITIAIAVLIVISLAVPIVGGYDNKSYFNNNTGVYMTMNVIEESDNDITIVIDHETGEIKTNGVTVPTAVGVTRPIITNNLYLYMKVGEAPIGWIYQFTTSAAVYSFANGLSDDMTITISNDELTFSYAVDGEDKTVTTSFDYICYPDDSGTYVLTSASSNPLYINSANDLYYASIENSSTVLCYGHGTAVTVNGVSATATITANNIADVSAVKSVSDITVPISNVDVDFSGSIVCKATVSGVNSQLELYGNLLNIVPLLLIVGVFIGAVSIIVMREI